MFFDRPEPALIAEGVRALTGAAWDAETLVAHAGRFSTARFVERLRAVVDHQQGHAVNRSPVSRPGPVPAQEAPRPRKMVVGVCHRICMSHQNDHDAT